MVRVVMSKLYKLVLLLLLIPAIIGCSEDQSTFTVRPVFKGTAFECEIWDVIPGEFGQEIGQANIAGQERLYFMNKNHELIFLDIHGAVDTVKVPTHIQERAGMVPGMVVGYCVSMDHFWVSAQTSDSLYKISLTMDTVVAYHNELLSGVEEKGVFRAVGLVSSKRHRVLKCGANFILPTYSHYSDASRRDELPDNFHTVACFKDDHGRLRLHEEIGSLPNEYLDQNMYINTSSYCRRGDSLIVNYPYSDSIDIYFGGERLSRLEVKCKSSKGFLGLNGLSLDIMAVKEHIKMHPRYTETVFDKYRNLYYRIYLVGSNSKTGKIIPHEKWVLAVFDEHFNPVTEVEFNCMEFSESAFYVFPEGILVRDYRDFDPDNPSKSKFELIAWDEVDV